MIVWNSFWVGWAAASGFIFCLTAVTACFPRRGNTTDNNGQEGKDR